MKDAHYTSDFSNKLQAHERVMAADDYFDVPALHGFQQCVMEPRSLSAPMDDLLRSELMLHHSHLTRSIKAFRCFSMFKPDRKLFVAVATMVQVSWQEMELPIALDGYSEDMTDLAIKEHFGGFFV